MSLVSTVGQQGNVRDRFIGSIVVAAAAPSSPGQIISGQGRWWCAATRRSSLHCKPSQQLVEAPRHTNSRRVSSAQRREVEKLPILDEKHCATQSKQSILLLVFNQKELIPARVHTSFKDKKRTAGYLSEIKYANNNQSFEVVFEN